jgi:hypothetical protein
MNDYMRIVFFELLKLATTPVDFRICQHRTHEFPDIHTAHLRRKNFPTPALYCCECGLFLPALARPQASGAGSPPQALPQGLARRQQSHNGAIAAALATD